MPLKPVGRPGVPQVKQAGLELLIAKSGTNFHGCANLEAKWNGNLAGDLEDQQHQPVEQASEPPIPTWSSFVSVDSDLP